MKCTILFNDRKRYSKALFLNHRAATRYGALASIIPGSREVLLELITNLNVILYLSTCHTVHIIVLILFMVIKKLNSVALVRERTIPTERSAKLVPTFADRGVSRG